MSQPSLASEAIIPVARDHDMVLRLCSRIRQGLSKNVETNRIRNYIDWFEKSFLQPHFEMEEQFIFPMLGNNVRVKKALANHRRINRLLSCSCEDVKVLNLLEEELATYIRFEERTLYRELEQVAGIEKLAEIKDFHQNLDSPDDDWQDKFWE